MKQKNFSSFLIIEHNRQYTPTEIIQTAFIFCIFNIMLEFLKPLPLLFRNIYCLGIFMKYSALIRLQNMMFNDEIYNNGGRPYFDFW